MKRIAAILCALVLLSSPARALSPEAQAQLDQGIAAGVARDYQGAIDHFQKARSLVGDKAPDAAVVYYNLGLAEAKIPGRELRAMAWFGAFLRANPGTPKADAVKAQIAKLDAAGVATIRSLIGLVEDTVDQLPPDLLQDRAQALARIAEVRTLLHEHDAAERAIDKIADSLEREKARWVMGAARASNGDITGALADVEKISGDVAKNNIREIVVISLAEAGDKERAQSVLNQMTDPKSKGETQAVVAPLFARAAPLTPEESSPVWDYCTTMLDRDMAGDLYTALPARMNAYDKSDIGAYLRAIGDDAFSLAFERTLVIDYLRPVIIL